MKTKLRISAILLLSIVQNSFSQEYHPFLNNSSWILNDYVSCCRPPYIRTINEGIDVVVGEYTYKKFNDPFPSNDSTLTYTIDSVYVREDVAARKVYKLVDGVDTLLYDFNLETGDTINLNGGIWTAVVDQIDCNGALRKRITLTKPSGGYTFTQKWIEGVGSNAHPFYPARNIYSVMSASGGHNFYTKCSFQNGAHIYGDPEYCGELAAPLSTTENHRKDGIAFSPNPFSSEMNINSTAPFQNATLKWYNLQGQLVREMNRLSGQKITVNRENLTSGLYFVQLFENDKLVQSEKIIVD